MPLTKRLPPPLMLVVMLIGAVMVLCALGIIAVSVVGLFGHPGCEPVQVPSSLAALALASLTGLAGLLAPTHQLGSRWNATEEGGTDEQNPST